MEIFLIKIIKTLKHKGTHFDTLKHIGTQRDTFGHILKKLLISHLLWGNIEADRSEIDFLVSVNTRNYKKYPGTLKETSVIITLLPPASSPILPHTLAPPLTRRPRRKMTARSYSWTTLTHMYRENGTVAATTRERKQF